MKISEIYKEYKIPPFLQKHQITVAGVVNLIADNLKNIKVDRDFLTKVCLLHDMGNLIKFDLGQNLFNLEVEKLNYWKGVQKEMIKKYGTDEHEATKKIVSELNLEKEVNDAIDAVGFSHLCNVLNGDSLEKKLCSYADMRVGPHGVISTKQRTEDGRKRYAQKNGGNENFLDEGEKCLFEMEKEIFRYLKIKPRDITDDSIKPFISSLREYEI